MRKRIRLTESGLRRIVSESVRRVLNEDHQNLPIQDVIDYLNGELYYLKVSYNTQTDELNIDSTEPLGLMDIASNNTMSGFFKTLAEEFKIIEKYTMNTIGYEIDGTYYDDETKNDIGNGLPILVGGFEGGIQIDEYGTFNVHFSCKGKANTYTWGHNTNNYDKTNYLTGRNLKPSDKMDRYDKDEFDREASVDKRDQRKKYFGDLQTKFDRMWKDTKDADKYIKQADSRPLHRKGSLNREL